MRGMEANTEKETLYYDGACPLCNAEISKLGTLCDDSLELVNVHDMDVSERDAEAMLKLLHYRTKDGETLVGLDANVAAWQHTHWGFIFRPLRWPVIRQIADRVYAFWAERRFARLYPDGVQRNQNKTCSIETTSETPTRIVR